MLLLTIVVALFPVVTIARIVFRVGKGHNADQQDSVTIS